MPRPSILLFLLFASAVAVAEPGPELGPEPDLERARSLREQAKALRAEAEAGFRTAEPDCYRRFFVNRCLDRAKATRLEQIGQARQMDIEASRIELAKKQRDALAAGRIDPPPGPPRDEAPVPAEIGAPASDEAAEAIRRAREAEAGRADAEAQAERERRDAARAAERAKAEAEAAERAEKAARDRERYDERIGRREAERGEP